MASVVIDSGPVAATDKPDRVPREKWFNLMQVKRRYLKTNILADCRFLLEFVQDAEVMWQELGFESAEDMICKGYELNLDEVHLALEWLKIKAPDEAVKYETAVKEGRKLRDKPGNPTGKNQHTPKEELLLNNNSSTTGTRSDYILARLARDHPDILSDYELGRYKSVRAAAIAAGIVKVQSPYEMIGKQLAKLNRLELMDLQARITAILQEQ